MVSHALVKSKLDVTLLLGRINPGVSYNSNYVRLATSVNTPNEASSVVPAFPLTAEMFFWAIKLSRLDFPALGAPIKQ
jgi:hypothetical protein